MKFSKYHGCGNDFIILRKKDVETKNLSILARQICNRYTGVGADGMIVIEEKTLVMDFYNQDGSRGSMCGNGLRSLGAYLLDNHLVSTKNSKDLGFKVQTLAGPMTLKVVYTQPYIFEANLGKPSFDSKQLEIDTSLPQFLNQTLSYKEKDIIVNAVWIGVKHLVVWVNQIEEDCTEALGCYLSNHPLFKDRINVDFVQVVTPTLFRLKTYERGVGFTKACGTGCAASYIIGRKEQKCEKKVTIQMELGSLEIEEVEGSIIMRGPAEKICDGIYVERVEP